MEQFNGKMRKFWNWLTYYISLRKARKEHRLEIARLRNMGPRRT